MFVHDRWCISWHITVKERICSKDIELLAVSMRPYYLLREFTQVIMFAVYMPPRHSTHGHSSSSLGTSVMPLCPPPCPHSHNMSPATPETIKQWNYFMPTARRHTTHPPSLPWKDVFTTCCISRLFTSPLLTGNQWKPAQLRHALTEQ